MLRLDPLQSISFHALSKPTVLKRCSSMPSIYGRSVSTSVSFVAASVKDV